MGDDLKPFALSRLNASSSEFGYIGASFHTFHCHFGRTEKYFSLHRGFKCNFILPTKHQKAPGTHSKVSVCSRSNWNLEMLVFVEGGKPENPEKNPRSRDENQQQIQSTYDAKSEN